MKSQIQKVRAAISTGLGTPVEVEVEGRELEQFKEMNVEEAIRYLVERCNGNPVGRAVKQIIEKSTLYAIEINDQPDVLKSDRVAKFLTPDRKDIGGQGGSGTGDLGIQPLTIFVADPQVGG